MDDAYAYCQTLVRERDRERYVSSLFAPESKRDHLCALYAFDLQLAQVADAVREPMAGEIRLQWWREVLSGERAGEAAANPVAVALLDTLARCSLSPDPLREVADARQFDLLGEPMSSVAQLLAYQDDTAGAIMAAAARVLDAEDMAEGAILQAARGFGLTRMLRRIAWDVSRGRVFVPLDLLAQYEVHTAGVLSGENSPGLRNVLRELRAIARGELDSSRKSKAFVKTLPALLPATLVPIYLARMEKADYDPFRSDVSVSALRAQFAIWRAARSGTI